MADSVRRIQMYAAVDGATMTLPYQLSFAFAGPSLPKPIEGETHLKREVWVEVDFTATMRGRPRGQDIFLDRFCERRRYHVTMEGGNETGAEMKFHLSTNSLLRAEELRGEDDMELNVAGNLNFEERVCRNDGVLLWCKSSSAYINRWDVQISAREWLGHLNRAELKKAVLVEFPLAGKQPPEFAKFEEQLERAQAAYDQHDWNESARLLREVLLTWRAVDEASCPKWDEERKRLADKKVEEVSAKECLWLLRYWVLRLSHKLTHRDNKAVTKTEASTLLATTINLANLLPWHEVGAGEQ
ncbi:MAG: hypothetical protein IT462_11000 [Planctomycetes bacterium]|nr:hypothetical protein [Planctomycetota bacterium]